MNKYQYQK